QQTARITILNNLFDDISDANWGKASDTCGNGIWIQVTGMLNLTVNHNTLINDGKDVLAYGAQSNGFVFANNIMQHNAFGIIGNNRASGVDTLNEYFPGAIPNFLKNVIAGADPNAYPDPTRNFYPASIDAVGFFNRPAGDYHITNSQFQGKGTDGKDPGVDMDALRAATINLVYVETSQSFTTT